VYSGPVAGYAFAAVRNLQPDVVAVVAPMHYPYPQPLLTTAHAAYHTPLGDVRVHQEAVTRLSEAVERRLGFPIVQAPNDPEHSLEIELPFLQHIYPDGFQLIPVMVREQTVQAAQALGESLAGLVQAGGPLEGKRLLLVGSTDLSHFYPQKTAEALDSEMLEQVAEFNPQGVIRIEDEGKAFACGRGALAAVMFAAKALGADRAVVLRHATSGDVTGDLDQVVGYGAAAFIKSNA
jgi:AmmeMemoRadiSam system protein B